MKPNGKLARVTQGISKALNVAGLTRSHVAKFQNTLFGFSYVEEDNKTVPNIRVIGVSKSHNPKSCCWTDVVTQIYFAKCVAATFKQGNYFSSSYTLVWVPWLPIQGTDPAPVLD